MLASYHKSILISTILTLSTKVFAIPTKRANPFLLEQGVEPTAGCEICKSSLSFSGEEAKKYAVGTQIPTLPFKTKNSWAGNIPITSTETVQNATLYFWLWGKDAKDSGNDLVIWLNGGPGCSSLGGMLSENGPFLYNSREGPTRPNKYSWTKAANMLFIQQPVNVAFTTGTSENTNELEISAQFASFLNNFYEVFPELYSKNLWITGESYAGAYIPYQFQAIHERPPRGDASNLKGGIIIDGAFTDAATQQDVVAYQYSVQHQKQLKFTDNDVQAVKNESDKCGLTDYIDNHLIYPPQGGRLPNYSHECKPWNLMYELAMNRSSTFDVYNINEVMSDKKNEPKDNRDKFLSNPKVEAYIHAPHQEKFNECVTVFGSDNHDQSPPADRYPNFQNSVFAQMIERSEKFYVMNGNLDALIITNGTALALQNLTWNNGQGFYNKPEKPVYNLEGQQKGIYTEERGLTFVEVPTSGHMIPQDTRSLGLASILALTGQYDWTKK